MNTYERVEKYGVKAIGKKDLLNYLDGGRLTPSQTIKAKCYECMGYYVDGRCDCGIVDCPNHSKMPYRNNGDSK